MRVLWELQVGGLGKKSTLGGYSWDFFIIFQKSLTGYGLFDLGIIKGSGHSFVEWIRLGCWALCGLLGLVITLGFLLDLWC